MPVAEPDIVDVLDEVKARLSVLLIADDDEYWTQVSEVILPSREQDDTQDEVEPQRPRDNQVVVTVGDIVRVPELDCPGNPPRQCWEAEIRIRLRVMPSELDSESIDKKLIRFLRDVRKAITGGAAYSATWHTMGAAGAVDSVWSDTYTRLTHDGTSQSDGYVMTLLVRVRVNENNL
jgi:hypothetical protein